MIFTLIAFLAVGIGSMAPASASISSHEALLSPRIHQGQVLTWYTIYTTLPSRSMMASCRNCGPYSHGMLLACTVTRADAAGDTLSRRVRAFLANQPHTSTLEHPPIVIRDAHEFKTDGTLLNADPICLIYSPAMYGSPPATVRVGTTWQFRRSADFGFLGGLHGTTTVDGLDLKTRRVSLHIAAAGAGSALVDMTVSDGGVIDSETDRLDEDPASAALPKTIPRPTDIASWSIQHQPFTTLWNYPPSEVVPFKPIPDIFDPNGNLVSVSQIPLGLQQKMTLVRVWHFGPFALESISSILSVRPSSRDVLLVLGVILVVILVSRAAMIVLQSVSGRTITSRRTKWRLVLLEIALAALAAVGSMWWIYR